VVRLTVVFAGSYGSTKRYKSVQRIFEVNKKCIVGASGEISDFQQIQRYLSQLSTTDFIANDGIEVTPREVHAYLTRVMYNRRTKCAFCSHFCHACNYM
jgi:20S proteasome subunit beta 7